MTLAGDQFTVDHSKPVSTCSILDMKWFLISGPPAEIIRGRLRFKSSPVSQGENSRAFLSHFHIGFCCFCKAASVARKHGNDAKVSQVMLAFFKIRPWSMFAF